MFDWTISDLLITPQNREVFRPLLYVCINMLYGASGKKNTMGDINQDAAHSQVRKSWKGRLRNQERCGSSQLKLTQHAITRVINLEHAV